MADAARTGYSPGHPNVRRLPYAVGLSLALHGLLFLLLWTWEAPPAPPTRGPLVVEILQRPARRHPSADTRHAPGHPQAPSRGQASPGAPPLKSARGSGPDDAPRVGVNLFPEGALAVASPAPPSVEPPDAGSPAEVITARIQGWRLGALAEQRVANGVDSYFSTLGHALRDGLGPAPPPTPGHGAPSAGQRWLQGWLAALAAADGPADEARGERLPTPAEHDVGGREGDTLRRLLGPMAPTQSSLVGPFELFRKTQLPPAAVLRLEQDADGHLLRTSLVASSGDATFDAWVQRSAKLALAAVPKPPACGAGLHPEGTRSEWAFYRTGDSVAVLLLRVY